MKRVAAAGLVASGLALIPGGAAQAATDATTASKRVCESSRTSYSYRVRCKGGSVLQGYAARAYCNDGPDEYVVTDVRRTVPVLGYWGDWSEAACYDYGPMVKGVTVTYG